MTYKFYSNGRNDNIRNSHKKTYVKIENEANVIITNTIDLGQFNSSLSPSNGSKPSFVLSYQLVKGTDCNGMTLSSYY